MCAASAVETSATRGMMLIGILRIVRYLNSSPSVPRSQDPTAQVSLFVGID